jgi:hypothetical protein
MIIVLLLFGVSGSLILLGLYKLLIERSVRIYSVNCDYDHLCNNIVNWGVANIPPIKTNHRLHVKVSSYEHKKTMAVYFPFQKEIKIYVKNHDSVNEIVDSLLHEVTHYKQHLRDTRGHSKQYQKLLGLYGYLNHPMEIEAIDTAKKYSEDCLKYLLRNGLIV